MNSYTKAVVDLLESLQLQNEVLGENTANKKSSTSLEDVVQKSLVSAGFQDLTEELDNCHKGLPGYFSTASTKSARKTRYHELKEYINDYGGLSNTQLRQDTKKVFPSNCFIRHPNGPQNHIDFLIIINGYMLYWEIKTGGGLSGKLNDKPIPAQFFVLMCSRHKEAKESPFTWFQMADMMSIETYEFYNNVMSTYADFVKQIRLMPGYTESVAKFASKPSLRGIVGWGKENNDWYRKTCNGFDRVQREQNVINILKICK
jgi:hypothetical protein